MYAGMSEEQYWNSTPIQVSHIVEVYNRRQMESRREKAVFNYTQAQQIAVMVCQGLSGKANYPSVEEWYPSLWTQDDLAEQQDMNSVANFLNFVTQHNKSLGKEKNK